MNSDIHRIKPGKLKLSAIKTCESGKLKSKAEAEEILKKNIARLAELQDKLYADNRYGLLVIFQAMDTAGKDGAIKNVMSGLNPQGVQVFSFKQPSIEELDHDYMWRAMKKIPERGNIGIFNRSYYEEVLVVKLHNLIRNQNIPQKLITKNIWKERYNQIRNFEQYLYENGILPVKIFLHISKEEQKQRLLSRIEDKSKNWKFSSADIAERKHWDEYMKCYEEAIEATTTENCPWYVVPADKKWYARSVISEILIQTLEKLHLEYPTLNKEQAEKLKEYKLLLEKD